MGVTKPLIFEIAPDTYCVNEFGLDAFYVLVGEKEALLIDTGSGVCDIRKAVSDITDKPYKVVLTHGHLDHVGGMGVFDRVYLNEKDVDLAKSVSRDDLVKYADMFGKNGGYQVYDYDPEQIRSITKFPEFLPLNDGDEFDLGGRVIKTYTIAGHTPGGVTFLDEKNRLMISGDCCNLNLLAPDCSVEATLAGLRKFKSLQPKFDQNFNGHVGYLGSTMNVSQPKTVCDDLIHICEMILAGEGKPVPYPFLWVELKQMSYGCAKLSYNPDHLRD